VLYLTSVGHKALEGVREVQRAEILDVIKGWSAEDQQRFARLMDRFSSGFLAWALDDASATSARA
jgi:DNA-binding MarR family transcriptional regulator